MVGLGRYVTSTVVMITSHIVSLHLLLSIKCGGGGKPFFSYMNNLKISHMHGKAGDSDTS